MTRFLGVDLGERRIGLATADDDGSSARPLQTVRRGRSLADDVAALRLVASQLGIEELVVGLPLDMRGGEGSQAQLSRVWAEAVAAELALPLTLRDERLTSHVAETRLGPMPRGRSGGPPSRPQRDAYRARVDREAAAIILQDELDTRAGIRSSVPRRSERSETPT